MSTVEKTIEIEQPVQHVYDQWTQFEQFPTFMEGVERVEQLDEKHLRWHVSIAGIDREFDTTIVEQEPDQRIAWRTEDGEDHTGAVVFDQLRDNATRVKVVMSYRPENWVEKTADATNVIDRRVQGDLERFKQLVEEQDVEAGAWRGRIDGGQVEQSDPQPNTPTDPS